VGLGPVEKCTWRPENGCGAIRSSGSAWEASTNSMEPDDGPVDAGANSSCGALVGVARSSEPDVAIRSARVPSVVIGYVKGHLRRG
jgi:hypothetical protein